MGTRYRLVSSNGSPVTGTVEQVFGVGGIAGIDVTPGGTWDVEYSGCTDVIWDTETSANDGPDPRRAGPHDGCTSQSTHRHPWLDRPAQEPPSRALGPSLGELDRGGRRVASLAQACSSK